jgi:hypothetical protein
MRMVLAERPPVSNQLQPSYYSGHCKKHFLTPNIGLHEVVKRENRIVVSIQQGKSSFY